MNHKWKTALIAGVCTFAVLSTGFSVLTLKRIGQLEKNVSQVNQSMLHIDGEVSSAISQAVTTISQAAEKKASIVADHSVIWEEYVPGSMTFKIRINPKLYQDDTQVRVKCSGSSLKDEHYEMVYDSEGFEEVMVPAQRLEAGVYEASFKTALADKLHITVEVQDGEVTQVEKLPEYYTGWEQDLLSPNMSGGLTATESSSNNKTSLDYTAFAEVSAMRHYSAGGTAQGPELVSSEVILYLNGEEILRKDMAETSQGTEEEKTKKQGDTYNTWQNNGGSFTFSGTLDNLKENDVLDFVIRAKDSLGFTYEKQIERYTFYVKGGWIQYNTEILGDQIIVY